MSEVSECFLRVLTRWHYGGSSSHVAHVLQPGQLQNGLARPLAVSGKYFFGRQSGPAGPVVSVCSRSPPTTGAGMTRPALKILGLLLLASSSSVSEETPNKTIMFIKNAFEEFETTLFSLSGNCIPTWFRHFPSLMGNQRSNCTMFL